MTVKLNTTMSTLTRNSYGLGRATASVWAELIVPETASAVLSYDADGLDLTTKRPVGRSGCRRGSPVAPPTNDIIYPW